MLARKSLTRAAKALLAASLLLISGPALAEPSNLHGFSVDDIDGQSVDLSIYKGKVVLIVNVASQCGFTRQYEGLQKLYSELEGEGFVVLGFPANDFGGQESGTNAEIKLFCKGKYDVTFPMFSKVSVKPGDKQAPLYTWLTGKGGEVNWNFNKFLVGKDGELIQRFDSKTEPDSDELETAIETALKVGE